jgi:hypothetical protein
MSGIFKRICASLLISMNCTSSSKIFSMFSISSALDNIRFYLFKKRYSSFLYFLQHNQLRNDSYFSNSNMISCFFSSNFLINSSNPSVILFNYYSRSLASSSLTCSTIFALSSINLLVLSIIFLKSMTFYFTELAIIKEFK